MEKKLVRNKMGLLPVYFKKVGLLLIIGALGAASIIKAMHVEFDQAGKDILSVVFRNIFILGLFIIATSRDKMEDEMTVHLRLKSAAWTFTWAVIYVIIRPLVDLAFEDPIENLSAQELVMTMLFVYLIMYYAQKRGR